MSLIQFYHVEFLAPL